MSLSLAHSYASIHFAPHLSFRSCFSWPFILLRYQAKLSDPTQPPHYRLLRHTVISVFGQIDVRADARRLWMSGAIKGLHARPSTKSIIGQRTERFTKRMGWAGRGARPSFSMNLHKDHAAEMWLLRSELHQSGIFTTVQIIWAMMLKANPVKFDSKNQFADWSLRGELNWIPWSGFFVTQEKHLKLRFYKEDNKDSWSSGSSTRRTSDPLDGEPPTMNESLLKVLGMVVGRIYCILVTLAVLNILWTFLTAWNHRWKSTSSNIFKFNFHCESVMVHTSVCHIYQLLLAMDAFSMMMIMMTFITTVSLL